MSSAYYGLFHFALTCVADEFVGARWRTTSRYALVYRSVSHASLRNLCIEARRDPPTQRYHAYVPPSGFGPHIRTFAGAAIELQESRHSADYDPLVRFTSAEAKAAISAGRGATARFMQAPEENRKAFLTLLLCQPR